MSELKALITHEALPSYLSSPTTVDFTEETKEWLVAMLEGGLVKIVSSLPEGASFSSTSIEKTFVSLLPDGSQISAKAVANAQGLVEKYRSLGEEEPRFSELGIRLDQEALKGALLDSSAMKEDQAGEIGFGEAQVYFAGLLEAIYQEFLHAAEGMAQTSPETGRKLIGENEIGAAWQAHEGEWSALFVREGQEVEEAEEAEEEIVLKKEVDIMLKIVMIQEHGTVSKLLKVTSAIPVKELCLKIKKKMLTPTQMAENRDYYLFWHDEENDDTEGSFLDDEKTLEAYPTIRNDSTIELVPAERDLPIYISETSLKVYRINEKAPLEKIIKIIVTDLGFLEASRFGVVLLGDESEQGETPPQVKLKESKSNYDVLAVKKDLPSAGPESPRMNRNASLIKKNAKRPGSSLFVKEQAGGVKNRVGERRGGGGSAAAGASEPKANLLATLNSSSLPSNPSPLASSYSSSPGSSSPLASSLLATSPGSSSPSFSSPLAAASASNEGSSFIPPLAPPPPSLRMSLIDSQTIVQTKDRSEWLKNELTLKEQGIEIGDELLLVRQEKIMSFYDRLEENPIGVVSRLSEQAENILKQLEALSSEIDSMKAGPSHGSSDQKELVKALRDHRPEENELQIKAGDEIEILKRDGPRIFGRLVTSGAEGYFPQSIIQEAARENSIRQSALMIEPESPIRIQSYLLKKGRNFDHWKKRYCKLRNHCIWYYKSSSDEKAVGHFTILNATITRVPHFKKKDFVFSITSEGVERHLAAQSEEELEAWLNALDHEKNP